MTGPHSIRDILDRRAAEAPDAPLLIDPATGRCLSAAEVQIAASGLASRLKSEGVMPGTAVAYAMANSVDTALVILGCLYGGYLLTAVNLVSGPATIRHVLSHSGAELVFTTEETQKLVHGCTAPGAPRIELISADWFAANPAETVPPRPSDDGLLMYTSGTTGTPKGVVLTHDALLSGGENAVEAHRLTAEDRALCVLPLYHINGFCVTLMGPLVSGGSVVLPAKFSVGGFWHLLRRHRATWFSVVPTQISYLLHEALSNGHDASGLDHLRFGRSASAPLAPDVQEKFEATFGVPIIETMGLTETAAQILSNPLPPGTRKIGSPGIAYGNEVIIGDAAQHAVPAGEEGEILVRGRNVMRLYRDNPEATAGALTAEGWLRTGDLGRMDAEGYVFVTGRLKELIIKGGENIAPREIDEVLYSHPDVIEAAAFPRPCPSYGQTVEAGVMLRAGSAMGEAELIALCIDRIGTFKSPERIHILPELPKGPSGKIQRLKIAEITTATRAGA